MRTGPEAHLRMAYSSSKIVILSETKNPDQLLGETNLFGNYGLVGMLHSVQHDKVGVAAIFFI